MRIEYTATAKTINEAIDTACQMIGKDRLDVEVEIIQTPSKGFLGMGGSQAKVTAWYDDGRPEPEKTEVKPAKKEVKKETKKVKEERPKAAAVEADGDINDRIKVYLTKVLAEMGVEDAQISMTSGEENTINVDIEGEKMGIVIGKHGETLDALQYLCSLSVNKGSEGRSKIVLDTGGYRKKRTETLEKLAKSIAHKVASAGTSVTLEPMHSFERRIIHATLQNYRGVRTHSVGDGRSRKVVISPEK